MEYKVSKEFLSKLGKMNENVKKEIIKKFPNLYDDEKTFCFLGQIIASKTKDSFYTIIENYNELTLYNITHGNFWKASIKKPFKPYNKNLPDICRSIYIKDKDIITKGMFRELLGTEKYRFDEFFPIDFAEMLNFREKLISKLK